MKRPRQDTGTGGTSGILPPSLRGATLAIHADNEPGDAERFSSEGDIAPPLSMSTTFEETGAHCYARVTQPLRERCETVLGSVEGTREHPAHCVLYSSGLAACFAVFAQMKPLRVLITGGYHGTHLVLHVIKRLAGDTVAIVELPPPEKVQTGDLVWLETPQNPSCDVFDIAAYTAAASAANAAAVSHVQCPPCRVVVDGTFAPAPVQRPLILGADCVLHSATKYLAGHSDAMCGALCVSDASLAKALKDDRVALGSTPGSMETWLLLRSLRTLHLRVERQSRSAAVVADFLHTATVDPTHPLWKLVRAVHHPSLPSDPGHEIAVRQMAPGLYGGCLAVELATEKAARALPGALKLFRAATSLGGVESLAEWRAKYDKAVSPLLVRLSVGLEDPDDLKDDLQEAILMLAC